MRVRVLLSCLSVWSRSNCGRGIAGEVYLLLLIRATINYKH